MASAADDQSKQSVTGYPPAPGYSQQYQPYPPPYQGYPPPPYPGYPNNPPYPYAAPPPATYYSQQYAAAQQGPSGRFNVVRFLLTTLGLLFIGIFLMSILTYLLFGAYIPAFNVQSMSVPVFDVSGHSLKASWDANVTVKNSNEKLVVFFDKLDGVIVSDDTVLALTTVESFRVGTKGEATFNIKFVSEANSNHQDVPIGQHPELFRDRNKELVSFGLRLNAATSFRTSSLLRRQANLRVFCENLQVRFAGPTGPGTLVSTGDRKDHPCLVHG